VRDKNVESPVAEVERWYHQLQQRAPFREHVMIPFAELRGRLDY
jgi:glutathione S-transferase